MTRESQLRGILLIMLSYALITGETVAMHHIGHAATPLQLTLVRSLGGLAFVVFLARGIGWRVFRTENFGLQVVRSVLTVVSLWSLFISFAALPLADATAVTYTRGVFLAILAVVILKEKTSPARWVSMAVGIIGGMIIVRPAFASWRPDYLIAIAGALLNAGAMVATKVLERKDSVATVMAYVTAISLLSCAPGLFSPWPGVEMWPWLLAVAVLGSATLYVGLLAIQAADLTLLAPFEYTRLIMAAGLGLAFFGEWPDLAGFLGAGVITVACTWAALTAKGTDSRTAKGMDSRTAKGTDSWITKGTDNTAAASTDGFAARGAGAVNGRGAD